VIEVDKWLLRAAEEKRRDVEAATAQMERVEWL
jgi:hypothetical protein